MNPPEPDFDDVPVRPPPGRAPFDGAPQPAQPGIYGDPSIFPHRSHLEFWNEYDKSVSREDGMMKPCVMPRSITQRLEDRINNLENAENFLTSIPTSYVAPPPNRTNLLDKRVKELEDRCKQLEERLVALETEIDKGK